MNSKLIKLSVLASIIMTCIVIVVSMTAKDSKAAESIAYSNAVSPPAIDIKPITLTVDNYFGNDYELEWTTDGNASGYEIYCAVNDINGEYVLEETRSSYSDYYYIKKDTPGYTYYYKVRAVYKTNNDYDDEDGANYYGEFSNIVSVTIERNDIDEAEVKVKSYNSLILSWEKISSVDGYTVMRSDVSDQEYEIIADNLPASKCKYTDTGLMIGHMYYYKIYGFKIINGVKIFTYESRTISGRPTLAMVKSVKSKCPKPNKLVLTWTKSSEASGYIIYKTAADKKTYKKFRVITSPSKTSVSFPVVNGKCYGIKIIAYKTVNGVKIEGEAKQADVFGDYYGYAREYFDSKYKRVYGSLKKSQYSSQGQARSKMTTIKVKVWDFAHGMSGAKVTKTKYITINKAVAPTMKKIFERIYKGKEKAPIYEVGGFSWRTGQHGQGLAVDINSNYNAMFDGKKAVAGSFWNPKKYAYSIKRHGDIEKAFEEYGFSRGFWGSRADYMHFSYFGT